MPAAAKRNAITGSLALAGLALVVTGIAGWSVQAAEIVAGLLALVLSVGYYRGAT